MLRLWPSVCVRAGAQPARAELASGVPGSQNSHAWRYCLLLFFVGSLTSWSAVNNAAILSEVCSHSSIHLMHRVIFPQRGSYRLFSQRFHV